MRWHRLVIPAAALVPHLLSAQAPAGYHLGAAVALPDSLVEVLADGRFRATVLRAGKTPRERELIAIAERLYPVPALLLGAGRSAGARDRLALMAAGLLREPFKVAPRAPGKPADRWWLDDFDGTWLPYAVTGGAVDYYLNRLRDLAAGRGQFQYAPGQERDKGSFEYRAIVRRHRGPGVAYVVELSISWDYWCSELCAMSFRHVRSVSFDANGAVVRITGDESPAVGVS